MSTDLELLGRSIKLQQYRNHRTMEARLATVGTTLAQWDALRAINNNPGASAHTLALATFQSDQSFGTLAGRLLAQGLIERASGHGRKIEHRLTASGEVLLETCRPLMSDVLDDVFESLSEHERATLQIILTKMIGDSDL